MKNKYVCTTPLIIDGTTICVPGKIYTIVDAVPGPDETPEDILGYCDIYDENPVPVAAATWLDVGEHFKKATEKLEDD